MAQITLPEMAFGLAAVEDNLPPTESTKQDVSPWSVAGELESDGKAKAIDYRRLVEEFGTKLIDDALLERFERATGCKPHRFLRRRIAFSHRDLSHILDLYERVSFNGA